MPPLMQASLGLQPSTAPPRRIDPERIQHRPLRLGNNLDTRMVTSIRDARFSLQHKQRIHQFHPHIWNPCSQAAL